VRLKKKDHLNNNNDDIGSTHTKPVHDKKKYIQKIQHHMHISSMKS